MPITRSTTSQGPSVTVLVGLTRVKRSSLRFEREFPRIFRRRKAQSGVVAPSESLPNPSKPPDQNKGKNRINEVDPSSSLLSDGVKEAAVKRGLALLHDGRATTVEEGRAFCATCYEWMNLSDTYCVEDWLVHARACKVLRSRKARKTPQFATKPIELPKPPPPKPKEAVKKRKTGGKPPPPVLPRVKPRNEAERRVVLKNDSRIAVVEPRRVRCRLCGLWVKLRNNTTYCSTPWLVHITRCEKRINEPPPKLRAQSSRESTPSGQLSASPESEGST